MAYGTIKVDNITFDNGGVDKLITVSGLFFSTSGALTVTGTISGGNVTAPTATFTTLTGTTTAGTTATFTSGSFTSVTGTTVTGTTANFVSGVFTTQISGVSITGTTVTATTGNYTALTGVTTTGTTANFVTFNGASGVFTTRVSGATITGTTANFTSGNFISLSGTTTTVTSGVFSAGSATAPSVAVGTGTSNAPGIYSPGTDQLAISTSGTGRLFVTSAGLVGIGTSSPVTALQVVGTATFGNGVGGRLQATTDSSLGYIDSLNNTSTGWQPLLQRGTEIQFHTNTAGVTPVEKVRITSAGNVGIGTTSPAGLLDVRSATTWIGDGTTDAFLQFNQSATAANRWHIGTASGNALIFYKGTYGSGSETARIDSGGRLLVGTSSGTAKLEVFTASDGDGIRLDYGNTPTGGVGPAIAFAQYNNSSVIITTSSIKGIMTGGSVGSEAGVLAFNTVIGGASTERMRIGSDGKGDIFSSNADTFTSHSSSAAGTSAYLFRGAYSATSTANGTISFQVTTNGNCTNTNNSYGAISDIKLKENIVDATSQWADVKAFRIRKYNFKEGQIHTQLGVVANEIELISPGLVTESPDRDEEGNDLGTVTKSVNYSVLYMKAVKALQEAMERIETLETRLSALEGA